ncbi:beta-lactamase family protein [Winogradskyella sp.]|uniref:beta-lactamase family protein n=1 Tax=Winogradskyella sp. TaxID=1883156 RepID=UPI00262315A7|nr:beta-lactamase family protein [Winogradskyella sp.]
MKNLKLKCIYLSVVLLFLNCNTKQDTNSTTNKSIATTKIPVDGGDTLSIEQFMKKSGLKGLSVAVFEDYEIIWKGAWGVKYDDILLDQQTAFSTASISKAITALLFAILEEKGKIDLKVPVNTYLKRWKIPSNYYTLDNPVTLEHLLSHTAGTTQHGFADFYEGDHIPTILESVQGKLPGYNKEIEITFVPGTKWQYSGGGYTIAMMALEDHLGQSLADLAQEHIFTPLGLMHTTMKQPNEAGFLTNTAKAHNESGEVIKTGLPITPQVSASGMWSNPTDMSVLLIEIQKALNGKKSKVFSENVARRITDRVIREPLGGWSLGWERWMAMGNLDWFSHGGANTGIGGNIYATMEGGKGIVLFGNGPNNVRVPLLDKFRDHIIKTHGWKVPIDQNLVKPVPESLLSEIIGRYQHSAWGGIVYVKEQDQKLYITFNDDMELIYIGNNAFLIDELSHIEFIPKDDGVTEIRHVWDDNSKGDVIMRKIIGKLPVELAEENKYDEALAAYIKVKNDTPENPMVQESQLNRIGYNYLSKKQYEAAVTIFKINTILYPNSSNTYDSLGEAYLESGDTVNALRYYKKAYEMNPDNSNAEKIIQKLSENKTS